MHISHTPGSRSRGLTMVELIVTLAIFGAVTTVLLGSFLAIFSVREQTNVTQQANDDVRVVLDSIEREIQVGNDIVASGESISFVVSARGDQPPYPVRYRKSGTVIEKAVGRDVAGDPCDYDPANISAWNPGSCWLPVTGSNVEISVLSFSVVEAETSDAQKSPLVTVGLAGNVRDSAGNATPLTYSTSITPRNRVTVSDVTAAPVAGAPVTTFMDIDPVPLGGCSVSTQYYLPVIPVPVPPGGWPALYTDCNSVDLAFLVTLPGTAGFHSLRYVGPETATRYGSGQTLPVNVTFTGGENLTLPLGTSTVNVIAEDLYGQQTTNTFRIQRVTVFTPPPPDLTPTGQPTLAGGSLVQNASVTFNGTTQNIGASPTGAAFSTNFTYCWGNGCSGWAPLGGHIAKAVLANGSSAPQDTSSPLTLSNTGTLRVQYCSDSQSNITESDETNNCQRRNFTVVAATPRLIICPTAGTSVDVGSSITLQARHWADLAAVPTCATAGYTDVSGSASWSSSNNGQATVAGGVVTGVAAGAPTISASYASLNASQGVTVNAPVGTLCWANPTLVMKGPTLTCSPTAFNIMYEAASQLGGLSCSTAGATAVFTSPECVGSCAVCASTDDDTYQVTCTDIGAGSCDPVPQCSDGVDNDGDGFTDYGGGDTCCTNRYGASESGCGGGTCVIGPLEGPVSLEVCATTEVYDFFGPPPIKSCPAEGSVVLAADYPTGMCLDHVGIPSGCMAQHYYRLCGAAPSSPDLIPTAAPALASGALTQGTNVTFSGTARNQGTVGTGAGFSTNFTYCWGAGCSPAPMIGGHIAKAALAASTNASGDTSVNFNLANSGTLRVQYCVDSQGGIAEGAAGEANNCQTRDFTVNAAAATCVLGPRYTQSDDWSGCGVMCSGVAVSPFAGIPTGAWCQEGNTVNISDLSPAGECIESGGLSCAGCNQIARIHACSGANTPPTANAGSDRTITLPTTSAAASGATDGDTDGSITARAWSFVSGPGPVPGIINGTTPTPTFSGMNVAGVYTFRYTVTDDDGATGSDTMVVTVLLSTPTGLTATAAGCGTNRIDVSWNLVGGATTYELRDGATTIYTGAATSFPHIGAPGSPHTFSVRALNGVGGYSVYSGGVPRNTPGACAACTPRMYFDSNMYATRICGSGDSAYGPGGNGKWCPAGWAYTGVDGDCDGDPTHECMEMACMAPIRAGAYMDTWLCDTFQENAAYLSYGCNIGNNPRGIIFSVGNVETPSGCNNPGEFDRMLFSGGYTFSWSGLTCLEGNTSNTCTVRPNTVMGSRSGSVTITQIATGIPTTYPVSASWDQWEVIATGNPGDCPPIW